MQIKGQEVGIHFNKYAMNQYLKVKGVIDVEDSKISASATVFPYAVTWAGYQGWCFVKQVEPSLVFEDIVEWVDDEANEDKVVEISKAFTESNTFQTLVKKSVKKAAEADGEKKSE